MNLLSTAYVRALQKTSRNINLKEKLNFEVRFYFCSRGTAATCDIASNVEPGFTLVLMSLVEKTVVDMSLCHDALCTLIKVRCFCELLWNIVVMMHFVLY